MHRKTFVMFVAVVAAAALMVRLGAAEPGNSYQIHNLVSDGSVATPNQPDPLLVNAWGIAASATTPWWVSAADTNVSVIYNATGVRSSLVVQCTLPTFTTTTSTSSTARSMR